MSSLKGARKLWLWHREGPGRDMMAAWTWLRDALWPGARHLL